MWEIIKCKIWNQYSAVDLTDIYEQMQIYIKCTIWDRDQGSGLLKFFRWIVLPPVSNIRYYIKSFVKILSGPSTKV